MEFKAFPKIEQIGKAGAMHITQKIHGSNACVVVSLAGTRYKKVFQEEETAWKKEGSKIKTEKREKADALDVSHLLQPIRLEKLLSRDCKYLEDYPSTLGQICKDYIQDLLDEGQIIGTEDDIKAYKKAVGGELFKFVKANVNL
jgi:hypothetical protein